MESSYNRNINIKWLIQAKTHSTFHSLTLMNKYTIEHQTKYLKEETAPNPCKTQRTLTILLLIVLKE